jgi:hypothetical protein
VLKEKYLYLITVNVPCEGPQANTPDFQTLGLEFCSSTHQFYSLHISNLSVGHSIPDLIFKTLEYNCYISHIVYNVQLQYHAGIEKYTRIIT